MGIIKVLVLVAACIASGEALNCLSCEENCVATPGRKYDSIARDQGVKFCHLLISNGKPTSMGCDTNGLKSYPADYAAVEGDDHKRCSEGQGTDARPASDRSTVCVTQMIAMRTSTLPLGPHLRCLAQSCLLGSSGLCWPEFEKKLRIQRLYWDY